MKYVPQFTLPSDEEILNDWQIHFEQHQNELIDNKETHKNSVENYKTTDYKYSAYSRNFCV